MEEAKFLQHKLILPNTAVSECVYKILFSFFNFSFHTSSFFFKFAHL